MDRRQFVLGAAATAALMPASASAAMRCTAYNRYTGVRQCEVGIPSPRMVTAAQQCPQWCWAACIQMIFAKHNHVVDQREIVARLFGSLRCSPAQGNEIVATINSGRWIDSRGRTPT